MDSATLYPLASFDRTDGMSVYGRQEKKQYCPLLYERTAMSLFIYSESR